MLNDQLNVTVLDEREVSPTGLLKVKVPGFPATQIVNVLDEVHLEMPSALAHTLHVYVFVPATCLGRVYLKEVAVPEYTTVEPTLTSYFFVPCVLPLLHGHPQSVMFFHFIGTTGDEAEE